MSVWIAEKHIKALEKEVRKLQREMLDLMRFHLAYRISKCEKCVGIKILDWEQPIILTATDRKSHLCPQHSKEMDEFNHEYASD